ncbi:Uncharacterized protein FWK35_00025777, partial [Aphis craccivora]
LSLLTGTFVEETQTIFTIQNKITENSYGEVSNLDSTPLAAPKISGFNQRTRLEECDTGQNELKAIRSELLANYIMGERLWNKFRQFTN